MTSNRGSDPDAINKIAQDFKRDMSKLGLAVSIKAGDGPIHTITAVYCPDCKAHRNFDAETKGEIGRRKWSACACGSEKEPVLA